jgi:hypothetical protein
MKESSKLLVIKERQIKTILKSHLTQVRIVITNKNKKQQIMVRMQEKKETLFIVNGDVN